MNRIKFLTLTILAALAVTLLAGVSASAQTYKRVYLSSGGTDTSNNCDNPNSPCATLDHAYTKVDAGGDIVIMDSDDYDNNGLTISKAVNIIAPEGVYAGIRASSGYPALTVAAGSTDVVVLRGLTLDGSGGGDIGVQFDSGAALHIEDCSFTGFGSYAIYAATAADAKLSVKDCEIRNENTYSNSSGIVLYPYSGALKAYIERTRVDNQAQSGVYVSDGVKAVVRNCSVTGSTRGLHLEAASTAAEMTVDKTQVVNNTSGVRWESGSVAGSKIRVTNSTVMRNTTGIDKPTTTTPVESRATTTGGAAGKTNTVVANGTDGAFSTTYFVVQ
jgi:hypothetical protein